MSETYPFQNGNMFVKNGITSLFIFIDFIASPVKHSAGLHVCHDTFHSLSNSQKCILFCTSIIDKVY